MAKNISNKITRLITFIIVIIGLFGLTHIPAVKTFLSNVVKTIADKNKIILWTKASVGFWGLAFIIKVTFNPLWKSFYELYNPPN